MFTWANRSESEPSSGVSRECQHRVAREIRSFMLKTIAIPLATLLFFLSSCATKESDRPHATVLMRDGSTYAGTVVSTSASEISIAGDDKSSRTIPMNQVRSIEYDDAPQPTASTPISTPVLPSEATHRDHYHPPQSLVRTRTYGLPVGTEIAVRVEETID